MGYDRIILIVAVVMCRAAVLQVLSQITNPGTNSTTLIIPKLTTNSTLLSTESTSTSGTDEPDCVIVDMSDPNCSHCDSGDIDDTWECYKCADDYEEQDDELCSLSMPNDTSKYCCVELPTESGEIDIAVVVGASVGGFLGVVLIVVAIVAICHCQKRRKRSSAQPPLPPPVDTNRVHIDADGTRYKFDKKGNKVFDVDVDVEMDVRRPMPPPLDVPHPPLPEDSNQVYDNDKDQLRIENTGRQPQPPRLPGQFQLPKPPLPSHQKPLKPGEPPRAPPPVPVKDQGAAAALRPPNPPPKPTTPSRSKPQPPAPPKPKPKPAVPTKGGHTSPSPQVDFQDTYEIPDAEKLGDFGETYDDVAPDNNAFDWQESYDDVGIPHEGQPESDGEDYEPVPKKTSLQSPPQSPFGHITQERIIREYGDDKLYQNQPVLDSKTKTSYRYRNLAMTKGEKIESEAPYLVKR